MWADFCLTDSGHTWKCRLAVHGGFCKCSEEPTELSADTLQGLKTHGSSSSQGISSTVGLYKPGNQISK